VRKYFLIIFSIFCILLFLYVINNIISTEKINIVDDKNINRGIGWNNNESHYSGSELSFIIYKSKEISFEFNTNSKADQDIQIFIDDKVYAISSPDINDQKLSIKINPHKSHTVTVQHVCTYFYDPCFMHINGIEVDRFAKISTYQRHSKVMSILGDSISTMYGKNNYTVKLAKDIGYETHNASILGSSVSKVKGVDNAINRYKKDILKYKSDIIIVFLGTNDVGNNVPVDTFEKDYSNIVSDLKAQTNSKILLVGILPRQDIDSAKLNEYNSVINKIAELNKLPYIDPTNWLTPNDFIDAIHPSVESQTIIASHVLDNLTPFLK
jgi:lysophospholipase L1-like esterase